MSDSSFRRSGFNRLGAIVNKSLDELGLRRKVQEQQALANWKRVVGPQIAAATAVERVRDGVVFVACKSSVWANELTLHRERIIKGLNKSIAAKDAIKDLRFSTRGYAKASKAVEAREERGKKANLESVTLEDSEQEKAREIASMVSDPELAARIQKAVLSSKRMAKLKDSDG